MIEYRDSDAITEAEGDFLYGLVRAVKPTVCVETGTHKGYSSLRIAQALEANDCGKLITCDSYDWGPLGNFRKHPELEKRISFHNCKGTDLKIEGKIDFLFIDSAHEFENVVAEFEYFADRLSSEAVVVFHDCAGDGPSVGVNRAINKLGLHATFIPTYNVMRVYCKKREFNLIGEQVQVRKDKFNARKNISYNANDQR